MLRINRVLHATDFSDVSRSAMEYSLLLARLLDVRLDVLHVVSGIGPHQIDEYDEHSTADGTSESELSLHEGFDRLRGLAESAGVVVRFLIGRGPLPGPVILDEAKREGANLIVLGAHGGGEAQVDQLGSVSTDIVRRSTCPVLIIPPHVEEGTVDENMERVVTFVSYAHPIEPVLLVAAQIAPLFGARLDVLVQIDGLAASSAPDKWTHMESTLRRILSGYERRSGESIPLESIELHPIGQNGVEDILAYARGMNSDMLILEAPGLASMDSPFERAVEELLGRAPCPVMLINTCGRRLTEPAAESVHDYAAVPM